MTRGWYLGKGYEIASPARIDHPFLQSSITWLYIDVCVCVCDLKTKVGFKAHKCTSQKQTLTGSSVDVCRDCFHWPPFPAWTHSCTTGTLCCSPPNPRLPSKLPCLSRRRTWCCRVAAAPPSLCSQYCWGPAQLFCRIFCPWCRGLHPVKWSLLLFRSHRCLVTKYDPLTCFDLPPLGWR